MTGRWWWVCVCTVVSLAGGGAGAHAQTGAIAAGGLKLHAEQQSAMWAANANAGAAGLDGALAARSEMVREREEARARLAHVPAIGVCEGVEGARAAAAARALERAVTDAGGDAVVGWLVRDTARVPGLTAARDARERVDDVLERFCAGDRVVGGGRRCAGGADAHSADVHPGAVLGAKTYLEGEDALAGAEWVRNIALPIAEDVVPPRAVRSEADLRAVLGRRGREARAALAAGYLQGHLAARLPAVSAGRWAGAVGSGVRDGEALSRHELLEVLARERFERPEHFSRQQAEGSENLLRAWIVSEAVGLSVSFEAYRDAERRGALLAARLSQALVRVRGR